MKVERLNVKGNLRKPPKPIIRPCEWGLKGSISDMETQLGSIEAYNMLIDYAAKLKRKIDSGKGKAQNSIYATSTNSAI